MCQKLWKLAGSRQSYCKNYQANFFGPPCTLFYSFFQEQYLIWIHWIDYLGGNSSVNLQVTSPTINTMRRISSKEQSSLLGTYWSTFLQNQFLIAYKILRCASCRTHNLLGEFQKEQDNLSKNYWYKILYRPTACLGVEIGAHCDNFFKLRLLSVEIFLLRPTYLLCRWLDWLTWAHCSLLSEILQSYTISKAMVRCSWIELWRWTAVGTQRLWLRRNSRGQVSLTQVLLGQLDSQCEMVLLPSQTVR